MKRIGTWFEDLFYGVKLHPIRCAIEAFAAFSVQWTLIEGATYLLELNKPKSCLLFWAVFCISVIAALWRSWRPRSVKFKVGHSNTMIKISFGDLFQTRGIRVISVNEFFDSALGRPVSPNTLHGTLITKCFGGHPDAFDKELDRDLSIIGHEDVQRSEGKSKRYPIGTTALVHTNGDQYLLFALAHTDPATSKAFANVGTMWKALDGLWHRARIECGGGTLNVPLVGSGQSGVGLPFRELLNLMVLSAIKETKINRITSEVHFVLRRDLFNEIDLREVKQHWKP